MASTRLGCRDGLSLAGRMSDRRTESRTRPARVVQVAHDGKSAYARCRDFSDMGIKLDLTVPLELNTYVAVALTREIVLCGTVVWVAGRQCGIAFDAPIDSEALLEAAGPPPPALVQPDTLAQLGGRAASRTAPTGKGFEPGLKVTVVLGPHEEQRGVLRWAQGNIAALELAGGEERALMLPPPE